MGLTRRKIAIIDVVVDAIKSKTDALPGDPADESQIEAAITAAHGTTDGKVDSVEGKVDSIKTQTDKTPRFESCATMWGGFEDELTLKSSADPAAPAAVTRLTPDVPADATITRAFLLMKFREITCAAATNYVSLAGYVQVEKVTSGSWLSGITIPDGTLDVASGAVAAGDVFIGNVDVKAQVVDGSEVEFKLVTLRTFADDLLIRDCQFGLQIYFIP